MSSASESVSLPSPEAVADLESQAHAAAQLMKLMSSEARLVLMCRLMEGEASVGELAAYARSSQTAASQHLAKLRAEGVVAFRRDGQTLFYRLADPAALRVLETLCDIYRRPEV